VVDEKKSEKSAVDENVPTIDGEKSEWCAAGENVPAVDEKVRLNFGSLHGSVFTSDNGHCYLSLRVFRSVCKYDLQLFRPRSWYLGMSWCGFLLALSIILQIVGSQSATVGSEILGIVMLILTALLRGIGLSGPEEWQIPKWKIRKGANYEADLIGLLSSR